MRESVTNRHAMVLASLPLLFHTNRPILPRLIKNTAPAKMANYRPQPHKNPI